MTLLPSLILAATLAAPPHPPATTAPTTPPHRVKLQIGPQTTVFTGPLRKDGTINYVAAWNQKYSKGVTAKNNGFIDIANTMGPSAWSSPDVRQKGYLHLRVHLPGKNAAYFVNWDRFAKEKGWDEKNAKKVRDAFGPTPLPPTAYPLLNQWVRANEPAIDAVKHAVNKPRWYTPMVGGPRLVDCLLPWLTQERSLGWLIYAQAMVRWHKGDAAGAWRDAMLLERLSRKSSKVPTLISRIVSVSLVAMARQSIIIPLAERGSLNAKQAQSMIADLRSLQPLKTTSDAVDRSGRLLTLDIAQAIWAGHGKKLTMFTTIDGTQTQPKLLMKWMSKPGFDINPVLRQINRFYNSQVRIMRLQPYSAMVKVNEQFMKQLQPLQPLTLDWPPEKLSGKAATPKPIKSFFVTKYLLATFTPAMGEAEQIYRKNVMWHGLTQLALALAGYHAEHHRYPAKLAALVPEFLPSVPVDLFIEKPLHYQRTAAGGILLYSVGENMRDDAGKHEGKGDDLVVRMKP